MAVTCLASSRSKAGEYGFSATVDVVVPALSVTTTGTTPVAASSVACKLICPGLTKERHAVSHLSRRWRRRGTWGSRRSTPPFPRWGWSHKSIATAQLDDVYRTVERNDATGRNGGRLRLSCLDRFRAAATADILVFRAAIARRNPPLGWPPTLPNPRSSDNGRSSALPKRPGPIR
jgi:hypothetical protein